MRSRMQTISKSTKIAALCTLLATQAQAIYDLRYCHGGPQGTCLGFNVLSRAPGCNALLLNVGPIDTVIGTTTGIRYTLYTGGACTGNASEVFGEGINTLVAPFRNNVFSVVTQLSEPTWQPLGCYTDFGPRTLAGESFPNPAQTVETCQDICAHYDYKYAGVEYANECYCDHAIRPPGVLASDAASCNMRCAGNGTEICGGPNRINIYWNDNGKPGPANPTTIGAGAFTYRGCYTDNTQARSLSAQYDIPLSAGLTTPETCAAVCKANGYSIVGVEFGRECWCGNVLSSASTKVTEDDCRVACYADPTFFCGNANRLNVWSSKAL